MEKCFNNGSMKMTFHILIVLKELGGHANDGTRGAIKDFNLPDRVSGALKILPDISKIYRTFPKSWHIYLVAYNFFMNHPCDIIQTLNNINI